MARRRRRQSAAPFSTVLLLVVAFVAGLVMLYFFTAGISLIEIDRMLQEFLRSRWDLLALSALASVRS